MKRRREAKTECAVKRRPQAVRSRLDDEDDAPTPYDVLVGSLSHHWEDDAREVVTEVDSSSEMLSSKDQTMDDHDDELCEEDEEKEEDSADPYVSHYRRLLTEEELSLLRQKQQNSASPDSVTISMIGRVQWYSTPCSVQSLSPPCSRQASLLEMHVRQRLAKHWETLNKSKETFSLLQSHLFPIINSYQDLLFSQRTYSNGEELRQLYALHALNHVIKQRSRVLKHNSQLQAAMKEGRQISELRDQGIIRPKVLILLPFREAALRTVNIIVKLLGKCEVAHHKRFQKEYQLEGDPPPEGGNKSTSFKHMFVGNTDDCFRIGMAVRKTSLKLYTPFYSSDIIIASPLGLRTAVGVEGDKKRDYDMLSSIELVVIDQADVMLMQNWEHVTLLMKQLHLQPKDSHGVDFSRVHEWALAGMSDVYCQTVILSAFTTPEINALSNTRCKSFSGLATVTSDPSSCRGVIGMSSLPQSYHRLSPTSYQQLPEERFHYFVDTLLPKLKKISSDHLCIFIPSYFDFVRLRNHFKREGISFAQLCEYTSPSNISRARHNFYLGKKEILLYTERLHFFRRFKLKGVRHLVFYGLPTYAEFYTDMLEMLETEREGAGRSSCTVMYSRYDALALSRVAGHTHCSRLLTAPDNIHTLITGPS